MSVVSSQAVSEIRCTLPPLPAVVPVAPRRRRACWTGRPATPVTAKRTYAMRTGEPSTLSWVLALKLLPGTTAST